MRDTGVGHSNKTLRLNNIGTLWNWALQGDSGVGHSREILHSRVGHSRDTLVLGTPGMSEE